MPWQTYAYRTGTDCPGKDIHNYNSIYSVDACKDKCSRLYNIGGFAYNSVYDQCWCKTNIYPTKPGTKLTCYKMYWVDPPPSGPNYAQLANGIPYEMQPYTGATVYYEENPRVQVDASARNVEDCKKSCIIDNKNNLAEYLCAYTEFKTATSTCSKVYVHNPAKTTEPLYEVDRIDGHQYHIARKTN